MKNRTDQQFLKKGAAQAAALLKALGHESRLVVLCLLIEHGELSVGEIQEHVGLGQSALSQHLARMRAEGLVDFRREAQSLYYRIADDGAKKVIATLKKIYCP